MHVSTIPEDLSYSVFLACSLKSFLGMLIVKNPWLSPRGKISMILSTLLANRRNYAIGMISRRLKIVAMWKIKRCMQILLVTMHSIKQTKCPPTGGKKEETNKKQKDRKDQEIRRIYNRNSSYKPFALQCDIYTISSHSKVFSRVCSAQKTTSYGVLQKVVQNAGCKQAITKMRDFSKSIKEH